MELRDSDSGLGKNWGEVGGADIWEGGPIYALPGRRSSVLAKWTEVVKPIKPTNMLSSR